MLAAGAPAAAVVVCDVVVLKSCLTKETKESHTPNQVHGRPALKFWWVQKRAGNAPRLLLDDTLRTLARVDSMQAPSRCRIRHGTSRCALLCLGRGRGATACDTHHASSSYENTTALLSSCVKMTACFIFADQFFFEKIRNFRASSVLCS